MVAINYAVTYTSMSQPTPVAVRVPAYPWISSDVEIKFMGSVCTPSAFTLSDTTLDITCTIPTNSANSNKAVAVAGDHKPSVHFAGVGFADVSAISAYTLDPVLSLSAITGSANGGTEITIPGSNFGFSLTDGYSTAVTIGGVACSLTSLSNTEIKCRTGTAAANNSLVVSVNGKSLTDDTNY